jgi:hypothetical protein
MSDLCCREGSKPDNDPDSDGNSDASIAWSVNKDGKDWKTSDHKEEYASWFVARNLARMAGRVTWKNDGCDRDVGGADGKTPRLTSFVRR